MEPSLLLDTHVVIRWLVDARRLSREQVRALDRAIRRSEPLAISAVSLLEIAILSGPHVRRLHDTARQTLDAIERSPAFVILPITFKIAAEIAAAAGLRDPADRTIVATARVHGLRLVTSDQRIIESKLVNAIE